jgi:phosphoglycolate phosphatase-like HAD superfamily hydrolase
VLLLFDIDGTLVQRASTEHAQSLIEALHAVHGVEPDPNAVGDTVAGRTDGEIARILLLHAGVSAAAIDEQADAVTEETCRRYFKRCPDDLSARVIPGIPALLESLAAREDLRLALVTGNYEPVARLKLKRAGIGHWFETGQGGFGSDSEDRTTLPPLARRRAGDDGHSYPRERTVVIGDTPRDIACARADSLRCIAVTTGPYGTEALAGADAVVSSAPELGQALAALA